MAFELGYTIAIPLVALALLGRWADNALHTSPWGLLVGMLLAVGLSTFLVYRKVLKILH